MKSQFSLPAMGARLVQEFARIEQKIIALEDGASSNSNNRNIEL